MITITLSVLVQFSLFVGLVFENTVEKSLVLVPDDPKVCMLQNITFTCNSKYRNVSTLYFALPDIDDKIMNSINGTKVNETAYELTLYNISTSYNNLNVFCCRGNCSDAAGENLDVQTLHVSEMPKPVKNFQCVVYDWLDSMNCSWDLAFEYYPESANVTLKWRIYRVSNADAFLKMPCPSMHSTFCLWKSIGVGDFSKKTLQFYVSISSPCGNIVMPNFTIDTNTVVKPAPALEISNRVENSSCITVMWKTTRNEYRKVQFVNYTSKWENGTKILRDTDQTRKEPKRMTVCGLHPYTMYNFTVQVKPHAGGFLSDPITTEARTYSDIPAAGPEVKDGGYMWDPKKCTQGNDQRETYIYWKPISEEFRNGILTAIQLKFEPLVENNDSLANVTHASYTLKCSQDYSVRIYACNRNGTSRNGSKLYIPKAQTSLQPQIVVEMWNVTNTGVETFSNITITWGHSDVQAKGYTVFWCKKDQGNCAMNSVINWIAVDGNNHQTTLTNIRSPEDFLYGVSMDTQNGSSGLSWQSCVYTGDVNPTKSPKNIIVTSGLHDNSLDIRWDKLACKSGEPFISMYRVEICQGKDVECGDPGCMEIYSNDNQLVVEDLTAEHWYHVKVQGITRDKLRGPCSKPVPGKPVNKSLKTEEIIGIVVGVLFFLVFAAAGLFVLIRNCLKTGRKILVVAIITPVDVEEKFIDIETNHPSSDSRDNSKTMMSRHESQDSGIPEDPTTPPSKECSPFDQKSKVYLPLDYMLMVDTEETLNLCHVQVGSNSPEVPLVHNDTATSNDNSGLDSDLAIYENHVDTGNANDYSELRQQNSSGSLTLQESDNNEQHPNTHALTNNNSLAAPAYVTMDAMHRFCESRKC